MIPLVALIDNQVSRDKQFNGVLLCLDPGETTGWGIFTCTTGTPLLTACGQLESSPIEKGVDGLAALIVKYAPTKVVYEDYKVYGWKTAEHSWAELHTPQLIGCIRMTCYLQKIPTAHHMAQLPKQFVTDEKLKSWGMYIKGKKHARDAIRHGIYYLIFTHLKSVVAPQNPS